MKRTNAHNFATRLRVALAASDLTATDLARHLGVSKSVAHYWVRGVRVPSSLQLVEICRLTWVSLDWIMSTEELDFGMGCVPAPLDRDAA